MSHLEFIEELNKLSKERLTVLEEKIKLITSDQFRRKRNILDAMIVNQNFYNKTQAYLDQMTTSFSSNTIQ